MAKASQVELCLTPCRMQDQYLLDTHLLKLCSLDLEALAEQQSKLSLTFLLLLLEVLLAEHDIRIQGQFRIHGQVVEA